MHASSDREGPDCPLCGRGSTEFWCRATDREYRTTSDTFSYHRCRSCDVLFIDPVPASRLSTIYPPNYYSFAAGGGSTFARLRNLVEGPLLRRLLAGMPPRPLRVLDVGGGTGSMLDALRALDPRVTCTYVVDLDRDAGRIARANGHGYFEGRVEDFAGVEPFDVILMLNLIEHVARPDAVLRHAATLLAPGGRLAIKTPNFDSLDQRLFRHHNWAGYHCPRHWVLFNDRSFRRVAEAAGLQVTSARFVQGGSFWAGSLLLAAERRGWLRERCRPIVQHWLFLPLAAVFAAVDTVRSTFSRTSQMSFVLQRAH